MLPEKRLECDAKDEGNGELAIITALRRERILLYASECIRDVAFYNNPLSPLPVWF